MYNRDNSDAAFAVLMVWLIMAAIIVFIVSYVLQVCLVVGALYGAVRAIGNYLVSFHENVKPERVRQ